VLPLHCTFSFDAIEWRQSVQSIGASLTSLLSAYFRIFLIPEYFSPNISFHSVTSFILIETMPTKILLPFVSGVFLINNFRYEFCGRNIIFFHCFFPRHIALNSFDARTVAVYFCYRRSMLSDCCSKSGWIIFVWNYRRRVFAKI
jgi:hypothetical protein